MKTEEGEGMDEAPGTGGAAEGGPAVVAVPVALKWPADQLTLSPRMRTNSVRAGAVS